MAHSSLGLLVIFSKLSRMVFKALCDWALLASLSSLSSRVLFYSLCLSHAGLFFVLKYQTSFLPLGLSVCSPSSWGYFSIWSWQDWLLQLDNYLPDSPCTVVSAPFSAPLSATLSTSYHMAGFSFFLEFMVIIWNNLGHVLSLSYVSSHHSFFHCASSQRVEPSHVLFSA